VSVAGAAITLADEFDEEYRGTPQADDFTVSRVASASGPTAACQLREEALAGSFAGDFERFEAQADRAGDARRVR